MGLLRGVWVSVQEECGEAHPPLDLVDSVSVEMNEDCVILAFVVDVATCFMVGDCCSEEAAFGDLLMTATTGRTRCWRQSGCDPGIQLAWPAQLASSNTVCPENQICSPYHPQYVHAFSCWLFLGEGNFMYIVRQ